MTNRVEQCKFFAEGREIARMFAHTTTGKDSILRPSQETIAKLSRLLDLRQCYVRKCLNIYAWEQ